METILSISANAAAFKVYFKSTVPRQIITSTGFTCHTDVLFHKVTALTITNMAAVRRFLQLSGSPANWSETFEWRQGSTVATQRFSGNIRTENWNDLLVYLILCKVFVIIIFLRGLASFDLFRHRRITIVFWGVHGLFFLEVCSWVRVSFLMSPLFSLVGLPTHPQNPHSWRTSLSVLVWSSLLGLVGLGEALPGTESSRRHSP